MSKLGSRLVFGTELLYAPELHVQPTIKVRLCSNEFSLPAYKTPGAAGLDLQIREWADVHGESYMSVETTVQGIEIPPGYEGQIRPRSGLAADLGITVLNAPGTIDADYRGPIMVLLANHSKNMVRFKPGDRIAQLVISPVAKANVVSADVLSETARGEAGLGSTGR